MAKSKKSSGKPRGQVVVNFDADFKQRFLDATGNWRQKPGNFAKMILQWWLSQPKSVQNLAVGSFDVIPEPALPMAAIALAEHFIREARRSTPLGEAVEKRLYSEAQRLLDEHAAGPGGEENRPGS